MTSMKTGKLCTTYFFQKIYEVQNTFVHDHVRFRIKYKIPFNKAPSSMPITQEFFTTFYSMKK